MNNWDFEEVQHNAHIGRRLPNIAELGVFVDWEGKFIISNTVFERMEKPKVVIVLEDRTRRAIGFRKSVNNNLNIYKVTTWRHWSSIACIQMAKKYKMMPKEKDHLNWYPVILEDRTIICDTTRPPSASRWIVVTSL